MLPVTFSPALVSLAIAAAGQAVAPAVENDGSGSWWPWLEVSGDISLAVLLVLACLLAWSANLLTLPGNWVGVALVAFYSWLGPEQGRLAVGLGAVGFAFGFALVGELLEFFAGAFGASRAGASRRSTLYAILGSIGGAITGAIVGIPVPVIGQAIAAILFAGLGATAGAMYGEWSQGKTWRESWSIGHAAFWGRTFGTLAKMLVGLGVVLAALAAVLL